MACEYNPALHPLDSPNWIEVPLKTNDALTVLGKAMLDWLETDEAQGECACFQRDQTDTSKWHRPTFVMVFTHADTAFAFKMRFG